MNWDVFISHATEDKEQIARSLAKSLTDLGVKVWYDEFELSVGDSLSQSIDIGLANSRMGIVILSPSFFQKNWTKHELRGLISSMVNDQKPILPIWHKIDRETISTFSPTISDIFAENTDQSLDQLSMRLLSAILPDTHKSVHRKRLAIIYLT